MNRKRAWQYPFVLLATVAKLATGDAAVAAVLTGPVSNPANGHSYYLLESVPASSSPNPFDANRTQALALGGDLVTINDSAEDAFLYSTFGPTALSAVPSVGNKSLLLGLTDRSTLAFTWIDGSPVTYTNWGAGQPEGRAGEDYAGIALNILTPGKWHDISWVFGDVTYAIVEVVPEPSAFAICIWGVGGLVCHRARRTVRAAKRPAVASSYR